MRDVWLGETLRKGGNDNDVLTPCCIISVQITSCRSNWDRVFESTNRRVAYHFQVLEASWVSPSTPNSVAIACMASNTRWA
jgi:hypothetical protein